MIHHVTFGYLISGRALVDTGFREFVGYKHTQSANIA